jgi:aspartate aminotransferase
MSIVAASLSRIKASPTQGITAKAMDLERAGRDVIALSAGEPDFDTPAHIREAAVRAMDEGKTRYSAPAGIPELREAVVRKFKRENGLDYAPAQTIVTSGGKQALYNALMASLDPGDEVIIPSPYWVSYPDMVLLGDGTPVFVETDPENGFRLPPEALEAAITPRTKWLILNNPGNPTGGTMGPEDLAALGEVLQRYPHVWVLSDDIYEHIRYEGAPFATMAQAVPALHERTLTMNGLSKTYCMTGWRIGYAAGPKPLIDAMVKLQSQSTSCACTISQWAGVHREAQRGVPGAARSGAVHPQPERRPELRQTGRCLLPLRGLQRGDRAKDARRQAHRQRRGLRHLPARQRGRGRGARHRLRHGSLLPHLLRPGHGTPGGSLHSHPARLR